MALLDLGEAPEVLRRLRIARALGLVAQLRGLRGLRAIVLREVREQVAGSPPGAEKALDQAHTSGGLVTVGPQQVKRVRHGRRPVPFVPDFR